MRRYSKTIVVSAVIAALAGLAVTGCGQARPENGTIEKTSEPSSAATAVTEAVVIIQTEAPVIIETEPETQPQTQPVTEVQTDFILSNISLSDYSTIFYALTCCWTAVLLTVFD